MCSWIQVYLDASTNVNCKNDGIVSCQLCINSTVRPVLSAFSQEVVRRWYF
jgi:hypothetical protein